MAEHRTETPPHEDRTAERRANAQVAVVLEVTAHLAVPACSRILAEMTGAQDGAEVTGGTDPRAVLRWSAVAHGAGRIDALRAALGDRGEVDETVVALFEALEALRPTGMVNGRAHLPLLEYVTALRHVTHACAAMLDPAAGGSVWNETFYSATVVDHADLAAGYVCRLAEVLAVHGLAPGTGDTLYQMITRRRAQQANFAWLEKTLRSARRLEATGPGRPGR